MGAVSTVGGGAMHMEIIRPQSNNLPPLKKIHRRVAALNRIYLIGNVHLQNANVKR